MKKSSHLKNRSKISERLTCDEYIGSEPYVELAFDNTTICVGQSQTTLNLSWNNLTGEIPSSIGNLTNLTTLFLHANQLTGLIPSEIWEMTSLTTLSLSDNQLSGEIPVEIENLTNLDYLYLNSNQISGYIPESICEIYPILNFNSNLSHNNLCPPYPECPPNEFWPSWTFEEFIGFQDTLECASCNEDIEVELWGECYNIEETESLNLSGNGLRGLLLPKIGNLTNLKWLNLGSNELTGEIPSEFENLVNLRTLNLRSNYLYGEIPSWIENLTNLERMRLDYNDFIGELPHEISNLTNLYELYLHNNHLSGEIPSEIWGMTSLSTLGLGHNQFTGQIPSEIENLTNIFNLDLQFNQLSGEIPSEIGNLSEIGYLDLNDNQLSGEIPENICNIGDQYTHASGFNLTTNIQWENNNLCPPWPECSDGNLVYECDYDPPWDGCLGYQNCQCSVFSPSGCQGGSYNCGWANFCCVTPGTCECDPQNGILPETDVDWPEGSIDACHFYSGNTIDCGALGLECCYDTNCCAGPASGETNLGSTNQYTITSCDPGNANQCSHVCEDRIGAIFEKNTKTIGEK